MAHNARIRSGGLWTTGSTVTTDELEQLDQAQYEAINGDDGGTWAPAAVITIGGSGLTVTGEARLSDVIAATWNAGGTATLTGSGTTMTVDNSALLVVTDDAEFRLNRSGGYLLRAYNDGGGQKVKLYGTMEVIDSADFVVKANGTLTADASSTLDLNGIVYADGTVTFGATSTVSSNAASVWTLVGPITASDFTLSGTSKVELASRSITRTCELTPTADPTEWLCDTVSGTGKWFALGSAAEVLTQPLHVPHGATITGVSVYVQGDSGHVGLPATPPKFYIHETDVTTGTVTSYGPYTDGSASTGAFQAVHAISSGAISVSVSRAASRFCLALSTESGANAKTLLGYLGARVTYTITAYDED